MDFVFDYKSIHLLIRDLVCLFLLICFLIKRQVVSSNSKRNFIEYVYYLVFIFFAVDALVVWTNHINLLPDNGLYLYACIYYLFIISSAALPVYNSADMLGMRKKPKIALGIITLAGILIFAFSFVINFKTEYFFTVKEGNIVRGPGSHVIFMVAVLYYLISFVLCIYKGYKEKETYARVYAYHTSVISIPLIVCIIIQWLTGHSFIFFAYVYAFMMNSIDEGEHSYLKQQKQSSIDDVILGLTMDFEWVAYVTYTAKTRYWVAVDFRMSDFFLKHIPEWQEISSFKEKIFALANNVVHKDDREGFIEGMGKDSILNALKADSAYFYNFRTEIDGEVGYYQIKFVASFARNRLAGFTVGIHSVSEETKNVIKNRAYLEHVISERTMELQEKNEVLSRMNNDILELLGNLVEGRDVESGEHIKRVRHFTKYLAEQVMEDYPEYGLTEEKVQLIASASALHDVGKICIPDSILLKPGKLTPEEFNVMKTHCERGCHILKESPRDWDEDYLNTSYEICRYHHEKYDGRGYPEGLKGEEIPIAAQIVSVADCYDALVTKRVYKDAYTCDDAINMILNGECGEFSEKMKACLRKVADKFEEEVKSYITE